MKRFGVQKAYLAFMLMLSVFIVLPGCGSSDNSATEPVTVSSTSADKSATGMPIGNKLSVTFSGAMDPATINTTTFTLKQGATAVPGSVTYSGVTAVFTPAGTLAVGTTYTGTITTGAKTLTGMALASDYVWSFTTGAVADATIPTVTLTAPVNAATGVPVATNSAQPSVRRWTPIRSPRQPSP